MCCQLGIISGTAQDQLGFDKEKITSSSEKLVITPKHFLLAEEGEAEVKQRKYPLKSISKTPYDISMVEKYRLRWEKK